MICYIYRSKLKDEMYLYLKIKDQFEDIPIPLLKVFGQPEFSMMLDLTKREKLARVDVNKLLKELDKEGFYLQVPPPIQSLLSQDLSKL